MLKKYIAKGGVTLRVYKGTIEDKRAFVKEVLSSLLVITNTGWYGAEYEHLQGQGEFVYLLTKDGVRGCKIDVTADSIMVEDAVVFGWLIHYFEESSIEGILYNEDGTEYKKPVPVKKPTTKPEVKIETKPPVKKQGEVISMFESLDDIFMTDKKEIEPVEEEAEEIEVEEPIKEKPKGSPVYQRYMSIQEMYPDRIIIYRMGDFFEVFGDNAKILANELELTLTGRDMGLDERVAMVGYPYHKERDYLNRILKKYSVAIVSGNDILLEGKKEPVPTVIDVDKSTGEIIEPPDFNIEIAAKLFEIFGNDLEGY